ncbi:tyrosine-type recombinase/integrase [Marimonas arenosa]|uniref:Tyrosine-type recombinase/integrase n=1 Tax=Marimonas arenosa TaxID=1795305 RepID=A0AAE4B5E4_9RHOB|nr:tyrosine-type recombinase/integrase [Marimonas arenosa]MDQ2091057.1 tyrosine-type recombinase/integrase [Marimonas arenosa]
MTIKIKHVDQLKNGVLRFRRKFPKDVAEALGKPTFQVHIRNREGQAFQREYGAILRKFDGIVADTRDRLAGIDTRSPVTRWHEALLNAEGLVAEAVGLEDDEQFARHLLVKGLAQQKGIDPLLIRALKNPKAAPPRATLLDARTRYEKDRGIVGNKDEMVRSERTWRRLTEALGPLDQVSLVELRRNHGTDFKDHLLDYRKSNGEPMAIGSCKRETDIIAAAINHAFVEFDIEDKRNPFEGLPWPKEDTRAVNKKLPLSDDLIEVVQARLDRGRTEELGSLWRLLRATGMRLGEAVGLVVKDFELAGEVPCVHVRPNVIRTLKTAASERTIPLVGRGLKVAQELVSRDQPGNTPVFPRYARKRGADTASAALMKAVRAETKDKKMTVHGLRHRVSDDLRDAGAPVEVRHGFLGHASQAVAETTYGSPLARLKEFERWARRAAL